MKRKVHIGDVTIVPAAEENPYKETRPQGLERRRLLILFRDNGKVDGWAFWYAPAFGGARRITRREVDWKRSGLPPRAKTTKQKAGAPISSADAQARWERQQEDDRADE